MPKTFPLDKPLTVHGKNGPEQLTEITLRDPTPGDQRVLGLPFQFLSHTNKDTKVTTGETKVDYECAFKYLTRLSGVAAGELEALSLPNFNELVGWLQEALVPTKN